MHVRCARRTMVPVLMLLACACSRDVPATPTRTFNDPAFMDPWPTLPDVLALRALLRDGNYAGLDSAYRVLADSYQVSFPAERRYARALRAFQVDDAQVTDQLAAWIEAAADARPAHAVRVEHLLYRAFAARGGDWTAETAAPRLEAFAVLVKQAAADVGKLMQADSSYLPAHWATLDLARIGGDPAGAMAALDRVVVLAPGSYQTRMEGIWALSPRWGGSLDAMWAVANRSATDSARNPMFPALRTFPLLEMSDLALAAGDTATALTLADSAVDIAREPLACITRAELELIVILSAAAARDYACASRLISLNASRVASRALAEADAAWQRGQGKGSAAFSAAVALADSALLLDPSDSIARTVSRHLKEMK